MGVCLSDAKANEGTTSVQAIKGGAPKTGTASIAAVGPCSTRDPLRRRGDDAASDAQSRSGLLQKTSSTEEGPFTGYNPSAWLNGPSSTQKGRGGLESSEGGDGMPSFPAAGAHRKSASIVVLERISKERASAKSESIDRADDFLSPHDESRARPDLRRPSVSATRTRRLSSQFNDIPFQLSKFSCRQPEERMDGYLHRVFGMLDKTGTGSVAVSEVVHQIFKDSETASIERMLGYADNDADGFLNEDQFIRFFVHLGGDANCLGPEFDSEAADNASQRGSNKTATDGGTGVTANAQSGAAAALPSASLENQNDGAVPAYSPRLRDVRIEMLPGQPERIKCVALSGDPRLFAVAHRHDAIAHIYNASGHEVRRLAGHTDCLLDIVFSPDRKYVATASRDKLLVAWDCTVGLECHSVEHPGIVTSIAFSHDAKFVYTGCQDNIVRKMTFPKGKLRTSTSSLPNASNGVTVALAAQHTKNTYVVFSRSCDEHAYVAQAGSLSLCMQLSGHESLVWQAAFSSTDEFILTCCERKVIVWRTEDFSPVGDFDIAASCSAPENDMCLWTAAIFGPLQYRNLVFAFNTRGEMLVFDLDTPDAGAVMDMRFRSSVYAAASTNNSDCIICGDDLGNVYRLQMC